MSRKLKDFIILTVSTVVSAVISIPGRRFYNAIVYNLTPKETSDAGPSITLDVPPLRDPLPEDAEIFERIFKFFKKAKNDQKKSDAVFLPSSEWRQQLEISFAPLYESLSAGNPDRMAYFLSNFGRWDKYIGIESTDVMVRAQGFSFVRKRLINFISQLMRWWNNAETEGRPLSALSYPRHGNQAGFMVDGEYVGIGSIGSDYFSKIITGALPDDSSRVLEVGGGYGKLFYFLTQRMKHKDFKYIDLDLPEVLCCAAYYLIKTFPEKKIILYGEYDNLVSAVNDTDILLIPGWEVVNLPQNTADIFINKNSLGEMAPETVRTFVRECAKRSSAIWHQNHEYFKYNFSDGSQSLVNSEYPIPDNFELIHRSLEPLGSILQPGGMEIYEYLYKKKI